MGNPKNYRDAIVAKCKECIYDTNCTGTWVQQVTNCTYTECSLYDFRLGSNPHQKKPTVTEETKLKRIEGLKRARELRHGQG